VATPKVLLFYGFAPLADPEAIRLWQHTLCDSLGIRGRIIVSKDGINATLGGDVVALKKYVRGTRAYASFKDIDFKWSEGRAREDGTTADFPRLSVRVRDELVTFGAPDELQVDEQGGVVDGGTHLTPAELHALVERKDVVFFDGRNQIESAVGHFDGAVRPPVETTREFIAALDSGAYDHLKDRPVVTYCTGGIRCEVLTPRLHRGVPARRRHRDVRRGLRRRRPLEGLAVRLRRPHHDGLLRSHGVGRRLRPVRHGDQRRGRLR